MRGGIILLSTYPDEKTARRAARRIVKVKLAACVSLTRVRSLYWWEGRIEDSDECLAIFKTVRSLSKELKKAIAGSHPYRVPEIVEIRMDSVSSRYLDWMAESVAA